jgi:hypothetical protein
VRPPDPRVRDRMRTFAATTHQNARVRNPIPPRWRVPLGLFLVVFVLFASTVSAKPSFDVYSADLAAWNLARTGDPVPDLASFPRLDRHPLRDVWVVQTSDGQDVIGRAPGTIAAGVPAYLVTPGGPSAVPAGMMAALLVALAVVLFQRTLRKSLGEGRATLAALLLGLTTPLWTVAADGMWPHTLTVLGILGMAWAARRESWWLVGVFGGVALWGRLHTAVICAVVGVAVALVRRRPDVALRVGLPSLVSLGLLSLWTRWMYGRWDPTSAYRVADFTDNVDDYGLDVVNHLGTWVSPDRGILVWTPLVALMMPALVRSWRTLPDWSRALLVGGLLYTFLQTTLNRFSGGDAFYGYRIGIEMLVCAAPALALSIPRMGRAARACWMPLAAVQWIFALTGAVVDTGLSVPAEDVWTRNAFFSGMAAEPRLMLLLALPGAITAVLFYRIWPDLKLESRATADVR